MFRIDGHSGFPSLLPELCGAGPRVLAPLASTAVALCGCSINLGSLSPSSEREAPAQLTSSSNIASLTEAIKNNPSDPQAYNMRGSVLAQAGKTEEALADFNKAISLDPNYGQAFANRGLIYRKTKRFDQAMADYDRSLALDPNYAPAYLGRGIVYKARKQAAEALEDFNKAISLHPDNAEAYYNRGLLYQGEKQHQFAIDDFTAANGLVPQQAEPLLGRALAILLWTRPRKPPPISTRPCRPIRRTPQIWITRGLAYERLGDKTKAAGSYGRAINIRPRTKPHAPALPASAANPARATIRSEAFSYRKCGTGSRQENASEPKARTRFARFHRNGGLRAWLFRQHRVKHRLRRRATCLRQPWCVRAARRIRRIGPQIERRPAMRNIGRRRRAARIVDPRSAA